MVPNLSPLLVTEIDGFPHFDMTATVVTELRGWPFRSLAYSYMNLSR